MTALSQILAEYEPKTGHLSQELQARLRLAIEDALDPKSPAIGSSGQTGPPDCLINLRASAQIVGVSTRTFLRHVEAGTMPKPIRLTARCNRWRLSSVLQAIDEMEAAS